MKTFRNLSEIQKYLEHNIGIVLDSSAQLEGFLAHKMSEAVIKHVYEVYKPVEYQRAGIDGGLADPRNMSITDVSVIDGRVKVTFENLRMGQTHHLPIYGRDRDSLHGEYITDTIVEGIKGNWYEPDGPWSEPRPFTKKMAEEIIANPSTLIKLLKLELGNAGFKVE